MKEKRLFLILLIILAGLFLRAYKFSELFYFAIDEEKALFILKGIVSGIHFPAAGHPTSIGFRLGPLYYYLMAPFFIFSQYPAVIGYLSIFVSTFTMFMIYKVAGKINTLAGLFSLILYAFSYLNTIYDKRGWQLSFESPLILLIIYSLLQLSRDRKMHIFPLTLALVILTQFEIGLFTLIPLVIICFLIFKIKLDAKNILLPILLILFANIPLLIFDMRHQFLNTKYLLNYFRQNQTIRITPNQPLTGIRGVYLAHNLIPYTLARTIYPSGPNDLAIQYANCPQYLSLKQQKTNTFVVLLIVVLFLYSFLWFKRKNLNNDSKKILTICSIYFVLHFVAIVIYTYVFQGEMAEYYLLPTFVFFFIFIGSSLAHLYKSKMKLFVIIFFLVFSVMNINKLLTIDNSYSLQNKIHAVNYSLSVVGQKPFVLDSYQTCWYSGGYRYLYTLLGREPLRSYMDQYLYEYYQPDETAKPEYKVSILTPELIGENPSGYEAFKKAVKTSAISYNKFGATEVYITKL